MCVMDCIEIVNVCYIYEGWERNVMEKFCGFKKTTYLCTCKYSVIDNKINA